MSDIRTQLNRAREAANDIAGTASGRIRETTEKAREGAGDLLQTSRDKAGDVYAGARDRTQRAATRANEIIQEHPIAAVAGAVAAGAVIAWMFPKSRAVIKAIPALATTAGSRMVEAAMAARAAATEGAQTIRESAGTALDAARENAGDAVSAARDTAASADLGGKASRLAEDVTSLIADRIDAFSEAVRARLPRR